MQYITMYFGPYLFYDANCPRFGQQEPLQDGSLYLSDSTDHVSVLSGKIKCSRLNLYFPCPSHGTVFLFFFSKILWFFIVEMV